MLYNPLHSNLVLFKYLIYKMLDDFSKPLHSNLVLFKYISDTAMSLMSLDFTFQSGSIQIYLIENVQLQDVTFTFQSGSIQMVSIYNTLKK